MIFYIQGYTSVGKIKEFCFHKSGREMDFYCAVFDKNGAVGKLMTPAVQRHKSRQKRHSISPLEDHFYEKIILLFYRLTCKTIIIMNVFLFLFGSQQKKQQWTNTLENGNPTLQ